MDTVFVNCLDDVAVFDVIFQIDTPTVKWLDKNLFIGEEIKEVYEEITKTIGTDHLLFDQVTRCKTTHGNSTCKKRKKKYIYDKYSALKFEPTHGQCIWDRYMCLLNVKLSD